MKIARTGALAALYLAALCAPATAAPTTVQLRIEGDSSTIYEGPITTDGHQIQKDSSGFHPCDGTNGGVNPSPGATMTSALDDAAETNGFVWNGPWNDGFQDFFINQIGSDQNTSDFSKSWGYVLNRRAPDVGGCQQQVAAGDRVIFVYGAFGQPLLELEAPARASTGESFAVKVLAVDSGSAAVSPASGARVGGQTTGAEGTASLRFDTPGVRRFKATRSDAIRSNAAEVCVYAPGSGDCGTQKAGTGGGGEPAPGPGGQVGGQGPGPAPAAGADTADRTRPTVAITSPPDDRFYRRGGPRLLLGRAEDAGGLAGVTLRLRRVERRGCRYYSGRLERFSRRPASCERGWFFSAGDRSDWSYLLPERLSRGRYVLEARAIDRAGNQGFRQVQFFVKR